MTNAVVRTSRLGLKCAAVFCAMQAVFLTLPRSAVASPTFPGELQRQLDMPCVPQCTLCHRDTNGGYGTVIRPFGLAMRGEGLTGLHPETIAPALAKLEQFGLDSDKDGVTDIDELRAGDNPNQPGPGALCPKYGCTAQLAAARSRPGVPTAMLLMLATGLCIVRFRGRRR